MTTVFDFVHEYSAPAASTVAVITCPPKPTVSTVMLGEFLPAVIVPIDIHHLYFKLSADTSLMFTRAVKTSGAPLSTLSTASTEISGQG